MHVPEYEGPEGPVDVGRTPKPLELLFYFLPEQLWQNACDATNEEIRLSKQKIKPVSSVELKVYTAVLLHMMIHP